MVKRLYQVSLGLALSAAFSFSVFAQASSSNSGWSQLKETFSGSLETRYVGYENRSIHESTQHVLESTLSIDWSKSLSDNVLLELTPVFYLDNEGSSGKDWSFDEQGLTRSGATLDQVVLSYFGERTEFSVGKQSFSWGKGDLYSPVDKINAVDLIDLPNSKKLSVVSVSSQYIGDYFSSQLIVIPDFIPNRIPNSDNRWTRRTDRLTRAVSARLGFVPDIRFEPRRLPNEATDDSQYGFRLTSSSLRGGWDFELSYFQGFSAQGVLEQQLDLGTLALTTVYPRYDEFGIGFSTTAGEFEIHGEVALHLTKNHDFDEDYATSLIGSRYSFYGVELWQPVEEIAITLEYASENVNRHRTEDSPFLSTGFGRALSNSLLGRVDIKFSEEMSFEFGTFYNLNRSDYSAQLKATHRPSDSLEFAASVEFFGGPSDSFFGEWSNNDRFAFLVTNYF